MLVPTTKRLRLVGLGMIVTGLGIMLAAILVDVVRLGALHETFGILQIIGLIIGFGGVANGVFFQIYEGHPTKQTTLPTRDDLTRIEGIGPHIQTALYGAGIQTYGQLAHKDPDRLKGVIRSAGIDSPLDPESWPEQARLAAEGDWATLDALQERLIGGRDLPAASPEPVPATGTAGAETEAEDDESSAEAKTTPDPGESGED